MPRPIRMQYEGAMYHVMNRGVNKNDIFFSSAHKRLFLEILSEIFLENKIEVHGFCLMNNHYHLLIKTVMRNLSESMQSVSSLYTAKVNKEIGRDGPLFRGRFKSKLIKGDAYLLNVSRYIHLNPSVSGITKDDVNYMWSSYKYYASDIFRKPRWVYTDLILSMFNNKKFKYVQYVQDEDFKQDLEDYEFCSNYPSLKETVEMIEEYLVFNESNIARDLKKKNALLILLMELNFRYSGSKKAEFLEIPLSTYRSRVKKAKELLKQDTFLNSELEIIKKELY